MVILTWLVFSVLTVWLVVNIERWLREGFSRKEATLKATQQIGLAVVVSPEEAHQALWINQDAYFSLGNFDTTTFYQINKEGNGVYLMVIEGEVEINGNVLSNRDAIGITEAKAVEIKVLQAAKLLAIEVPMTQ